MDTTGISPDFASAVKFAEGACFWTNFSKDVQYPTSAVEKMSTLAGWESLGEPDEIGFPESKKSNSKFKKGGHLVNFVALGGETEFTFKASFLEADRASVNKLRYGLSAVETSEDGSFKAINVTQDAGRPIVVPLVVDFIEDSGHLLRHIIKRAAVSAFDTVSNKPGDAKIVGFTFTALDSKDGSAFYQILRAKKTAGVSADTSHLG